MPQRMPAIYFGHGNPMNALLQNPYTEQWAAIGASLPRPKAILCVSAHWYIQDAAVTVSTAPRTIHDFGGFPRLWRPSAAERDLRQLLVHRHKLVGIRGRVKNGLQHLMLNRGVQMKRKLWSQAGQQALRELPLEGWAAKRRQDLLQLLAPLDEHIRELDKAVETAALANPRAQLLMTQPGVGPVTALAFVLTIGDVTRFKRGKQVASYLGLIPSENSSSNRRRLGSITKQGNPFLRMLLVESVQTVNRLDEGFRKQYQHRCHRMAKGVAKVAAARRLAVRLYWMLRTNTAYPAIAYIESSSR
jgi:transposase